MPAADRCGRGMSAPRRTPERRVPLSAAGSDPCGRSRLRLLGRFGVVGPSPACDRWSVLRVDGARTRQRLHSVPCVPRPRRRFIPQVAVCVGGRGERTVFVVALPYPRLCARGGSPRLGSRVRVPLRRVLGGAAGGGDGCRSRTRARAARDDSQWPAAPTSCARHRVGTCPVTMGRGQARPAQVGLERRERQKSRLVKQIGRRLTPQGGTASPDPVVDYRRSLTTDPPSGRGSGPIVVEATTAASWRACGRWGRCGDAAAPVGVRRRTEAEGVAAWRRFPGTSHGDWTAWAAWWCHPVCVMRCGADCSRRSRPWPPRAPARTRLCRCAAPFVVRRST